MWASISRLGGWVRGGGGSSPLLHPDRLVEHASTPVKRKQLRPRVPLVQKVRFRVSRGFCQRRWVECRGTTAVPARTRRAGGGSNVFIFYFYPRDLSDGKNEREKYCSRTELKKSHVVWSTSQCRYMTRVSGADDHCKTSATGY